MDLFLKIIKNLKFELMKLLLSTTLIFFSLGLPSLYAISISDELYEGTEHFIIRTKRAVYYYDKAGGGFSRMIDRFGNDWISFKNVKEDTFPQSAASTLRGIPNFVIGSEDDGVGHPGFDKCYSFKVDDQTILTISKSGNWQWRWKFYDNYASVTIEKTDPDHKYWFLYAGPIAGRFAPDKQYWGTNLGGPRREIGNLNLGDRIYANWHWAYFGDDDTRQILFVAIQHPDRSIDALGFLGNSDKEMDSEDGMIMFGFGKHGETEPQLSDKDITFYIGFYNGRIKNESQHASVKKEILSFLK